MKSETMTPLSSSGRVLIVGGYGQVGRSIAERLAVGFPDRVTVAGRNMDKAKAVAAKIGYGTEGRALDIFGSNDPSVLADVSLVIVCLDQTNTRFVEQCLSLGIHYIDITADYTFLSEVEKLDNLAKQEGAAAILSVGVAPGLTNMLAAHARDQMERTDRIDILLESGLGDRHGQGAIEWILDNLDVSYQVMEGGHTIPVRSFGDSTDLRLAGQDQKLPAYRYNFSDQHVLSRTLNVPSVSTWVRYDSRFATWLFAVSSRIGLGRLLRRPVWRKSVVWLFMNLHMGTDICGISVRAAGRKGSEPAETIVGVTGRKEALMTAIVTAETARQVLSNNPAPGVHHSEQVIALDPVVTALRNELPDLVVAL
ncbi:saccharopine dehydrogenase NADP-binding domain-containing protein [Microbulbifer sp. CnH-101-E]|uniref:saccharopine dehydrogenase NADP-binding domain-containing protein n=1 Tax=unclassified Microbulbifer TaxID=2619833 RepID=UPI00403A25A4